MRKKLLYWFLLVPVGLLLVAHLWINDAMYAIFRFALPRLPKPWRERLQPVTEWIVTEHIATISEVNNWLARVWRGEKH